MKGSFCDVKFPVEANLQDVKWIWYEEPNYNLVNSWVQARRTFELETVPAKALICITADTQYRLYVNGTHVNRGPARGFQETWPYDEIDIAPFLKKGENALAVLIHNLGIGTFQYIHQGYAGFLLVGKVGAEDISSGPKWRVRPALGFKRVTTRVSRQMGFQEFFDARLDDESWILPTYDDSNPSAVRGGWGEPDCRSFGSMPWHSLEERGIPLLREETKVPLKIISKATGKCRQDYLEATDVVTLFLEEEKEWKNAGDGLDRTEDWATVVVPPTGRESYLAYCIDFGKEVVGSLRLVVEGATGEEMVDSLVCEGIKGKVPEIKSPLLGCRQAFGNRLFVRAGKTEHEQFDYWGFRYLILIIRNSTKELNVKVRLHWVGYPLEVKASFQSSNKKLDKIYEVSAWTQQCCMLDAYVDCPGREQVQWWGDSRVQGKNTFYLSADARLFKRGIRQIGTQELKNGVAYGHAPTISHNCILPDFTLVWITTHWDYYWQTGDLSLFRDMTARIHRAFDYFHRMTATKNGLLPHDERYWLFIDWSPFFKDGYSTLYNLFYLMALRDAIKLFNLSGDKKSARLYAGREKELLSAIENKLFNKETGTFYGGLSWDEEPVAQDSPHVLSLAILLDLCPEHHQTFVEEFLLPFVNGEREHPVLPTPYFMFYIFEALKKTGRTKEVIDCIERWWGEMIDRGLSTTEEVWNGNPGFDSLCHAWAAHPIIHLSNILLGIWQEKPRWEEICFSPTFSHADHVRGKVATPHGIIETSWERTEAKVKVSLNLPPGIRGKVVLPGKKKEMVQDRCEWVVDLKPDE